MAISGALLCIIILVVLAAILAIVGAGFLYLRTCPHELSSVEQVYEEADEPTGATPTGAAAQSGATPGGPAAGAAPQSSPTPARPATQVGRQREAPPVVSIADKAVAVAMVAIRRGMFDASSFYAIMYDFMEGIHSSQYNLWTTLVQFSLSLLVVAFITILLLVGVVNSEAGLPILAAIGGAAISRGISASGGSSSRGRAPSTSTITDPNRSGGAPQQNPGQAG